MKKVILRPLEEADIANVQRWMNDPDIAMSLLRSWPMNQSNAASWYAGRKDSINSLLFAIDDAADNSHVGVVGLHDIHWVHRLAELWIMIGEKSKWGRGLATEAVNLSIVYAFKQLGLRKIFLKVSSTNNAALAVYKKAGFVEEGVLKDELYINGNYITLMRMSLFFDSYNTRVE